MLPFPVLNGFSSSLKGSRDAGVGIKLIWALWAANANRIRFSSNTGVPHLIDSVAFGATFRSSCRSSRSFSRACSGASSMYSSTVLVSWSRSLVTQWAMADEYTKWAGSLKKGVHRCGLALETFFVTFLNCTGNYYGNRKANDPDD